MADLKISQLTGATTPLAGTEVLPIVQSGATKKVTVADLTTGRAISATQLTLTTGNLIVASGQGIDFSATPGTGTSELLNDYEEGTFTPVIRGLTSAGVGTYSAQAGSYTKVGNRVSFTIYLSWSAHTGTGNMAVDGLPFTVTSGNENFAAVAVYLDGDIPLTATNILQARTSPGAAQLLFAQYAIGGSGIALVPISSSGGVMLTGNYYV
jgi:hypothetical protein